ncbi:MAG TPA: 3D domain-containing protein [Verrucomicrobiales bacterium]|jgi:3D (Asp-Asp-Asp) domain-containing protein|nr:3D domain-containing protein [Verrucomicrobiales bacterium]
MAYRPILAVAAILCSALCSCSSTSPSLASAKVYRNGQVDNATYYKVKTTAYSHVEADSLKYGVKNAAGGDLQYGMVRSAAADWSVFPLGTIFKIEGTPHIYRVDDYGRALVGTKTIDLYKPSMAGIKDWGARNVKIKVLKWGSYAQSMNVLSERQSYAHVRAMIQGIKRKSDG